MLKTGNLWYLTGDMHIHTHHSDGERLEKMIARVVNCGFDFCAVTDHDTYNGSVSALELAGKAGGDFPIILRGQEATCSGCHILAYGTLKSFSKTGTLPEVCRNIRNSGGYAVAAHPDWEFTRSSFRTNGLFEYLAENGFLDGVELMNFPFPEDNAPEKEWTNNYTLEKFRSGRFFSVTAGSDAHRAYEITAERFVGVFSETPDEAGILDAIFNKHLSVAVWNNCVIGTPEAVKLFEELKERAYPAENTGVTVSGKAERSGTTYTIGKGFEDSISFCGTLERKEGGKLFSSGHTSGYDLLLGRSGNRRSAFCIERDNGVELKSVPAAAANGTAIPGFSFTLPEFLAREEIIFEGKVNGKPFCISNNFGAFTLPALPLETGKNIIEAASRTADGIPLGSRVWDYPVSAAGSWQELELLNVQANAPDGKEVSAKFRFVSRNGKLHLEMQITDHFFCQPYSGFGMYMGDSIQFGIDPGCAACENDLVEHRIWELGIALTAKGCELVIYNLPENRSRDEISCWKFSGRRDGITQIFEVEIPEDVLAPGKIFGFNMIYNINDGAGRRGYLAWRNGIGDRKRSADWGFII